LAKKYKLTSYEFLNFYIESKETYPITEEFSTSENGRYKQSKGGYISFFAKKGNFNPNQKEHLLESYKAYLDKKENSILRSSENIYSMLKCPELLLWIAEASGVDSETVKKASEKAKEIINQDKQNNRLRNKAGREILKLIPWATIKEALLQRN